MPDKTKCMASKAAVDLHDHLKRDMMTLFSLEKVLQKKVRMLMLMMVVVVVVWWCCLWLKVVDAAAPCSNGGNKRGLRVVARMHSMASAVPLRSTESLRRWCARVSSLWLHVGVAGMLPV